MATLCPGIVVFHAPHSTFPHWEPIVDIKYSGQVTMPNCAQLYCLLIREDKEFSAASITEKEKFLTASKRADFLFASNARQAGARTNRAGGILVGVDRNGYEVWATVIRGADDLYACDLPCRALVEFVVVKDMSYVADTCAVLVTSLTSLNDIAHWEDSIWGDNFAKRFAFIYDALVAEAKGSTG